MTPWIAAFVIHGLLIPGMVLLYVAHYAGSRRTCTRCRYDLAGSYSSECCPECGMPLADIPSRLEQTASFRRAIEHMGLACFTAPLAVDLAFVLHWLLC